MIKILDFYDTWCQPCKAMQPILAEVKAEINVAIEPIKVSDNADVANKYGVRGLPCLIKVDSQSNMLGRLDGIHTKEEIIEWLKEND